MGSTRRAIRQRPRRGRPQSPRRGAMTACPAPCEAFKAVLSAFVTVEIGLDEPAVVEAVESG